ncbi:MAG TPA: PAS domain S-box protein, partial [Lacunisphaera sp.]|nr:PAS domain S-box protein [Lacunisphaera sp.]
MPPPDSTGKDAADPDCGAVSTPAGSPGDRASTRRFGHGIVFGGCAVAAGIAGVMLWNWITGTMAVSRSLPMAPSTAGAILLLALALAVRERCTGAWLGKGIPAALAMAVAAAAVLVMLRALGVPNRDWEALLVHPQKTLGGFPVGRMSFLTALVLLVLSGSVFAPTLRRTSFRAVRRGFVVGTAGAAMFCGVVASTHVAGVPLFYRLGFVPMAWSTSVALLALSAAAFVASNDRASLASLWRSIHVRLFTGFAAIVGLMSFLFAMAYHGMREMELATAVSDGGNAALFTSLFLAVGIISVLGTLALGLHLNRTFLAYDRERNRGEAALRRSEAELKNAQRIAQAGSWWLDAESNEVVWTEELYRMLGLDPARSPPPYPEHHRLFTPESWERLSTALPRTRETGEPYELELEMVRPDGSRGWMLARGEPVRSQAGSIIGLRGSALDITARKQAEQALQQSEEAFRTLAESVPQIVWVTRADGWNTYFNQQWVEYTGLTLEDSYGHGWNIPFHPDDQKRAWEAWQQATHHGATYSLEVRLRRKDGVYRWWLVRGVPQLDANGKTVKWFGTCTDVHDLKKAEMEIRELNASLEQRVAGRTRELHRRMTELQTIFETAPMGLAIAEDAEGRRIRGNPMIERLTGVAREKELSLSAGAPPAYHARDGAGREVPPSELPMQRACRGEVVTGWTMEIVRPDGQVAVLHSNATPLRDENGNLCGAVGAFMDVTELRRADEHIRRLNAALQSRAADLAAANRELESFSYSVSHDLRAPLRSIDGFSRILLRDQAAALDAPGREHLSRIRAAT